jgi:hypothetical protein
MYARRVKGYNAIGYKICGDRHEVVTGPVQYPGES